MSIFQIVLTRLNQKSISNPQKTIADVLIEGSFTRQDLLAINDTTKFPTNNLNPQKLPEGPYNSQMAMMQFTRKIGPFLSDKILYHITHALADIETERNTNSQAYRTSTLAKCFIIYELERHAVAISKGEPLPAVFLSHMHDYILPLCRAIWPHNIADNVNQFASFNFNNDLMQNSTKDKFRAAGCTAITNFDLNQLIDNFSNSDFKIDENQNSKSLKEEEASEFSFYSFINAFDAQKFDAGALSTECENKQDISSYLADLKKQYEADKLAFETKNISRPVTPSGTSWFTSLSSMFYRNPSEPASAPTSPLVNKRLPAPLEKRTTSPVLSKKSNAPAKLTKRATVTSFGLQSHHPHPKLEKHATAPATASAKEPAKRTDAPTKITRRM